MKDWKEEFYQKYNSINKALTLYETDEFGACSRPIADSIVNFISSLLEEQRKEVLEEDIDLLKRIQGYLSPSTTNTLVYLTPSQGLRNAADYLEIKESDLNKFDNLIKSLINKQ